MNPSGPPTAFDAVTVAGVPVFGGGGGLPVTFGNTYFVDPEKGDDSYSGEARNAAFASVEFALTKLTTNNDDVLVLRGSSTAHVLDAMLAVAINRVHFVGLDGAWRPYGQGARIQFTGTTGATNLGVMKNTGIRNSFTNIKFDSGSTITESLYCVLEGGEYAQYTNCEFYKSTDLDQTGAAEFVWNGDSTIMDNCTIGSLANALVGDIIRPCVLLTAGIAGAGKVCRDGLIRNTRMWRQASNANNRFIKAANATDVERMLELQHVGFLCNGVVATRPDVCIDSPTLTRGAIVLDPRCYTNATKIATATGVIVTGAAPNGGAGTGTNAT